MSDLRKMLERAALKSRPQQVTVTVDGEAFQFWIRPMSAGAVNDLNDAKTGAERTRIALRACVVDESGKPEFLTGDGPNALETLIQAQHRFADALVEKCLEVSGVTEQAAEAVSENSIATAGSASPLPLRPN